MITPTEIPFTTVISQSSLIENLYVAKCATSFLNSKGRNTFVSGFGFDIDKNKAKDKAYFEFLEHFFSLLDINKQINFKAASLLDTDLIKEFNRNEILIGNSISASGLSCHISYKEAINHAFLELIERHFCCTFWYKKLDKLIQIGIEELIIDEKYELSFFTLDRKEPVPFVVTKLSNNKDIFILGSALKFNLNDAIYHSKFEAIMLLENLKSENLLIANNKNILAKIKSLKGENAIALQQYFNSLINASRTINLKNYNSINSLLSSCRINLKDLWICPIYRFQEIVIVRALSDKLFTLENERLNIENNILDPFC